MTLVANDKNIDSPAPTGDVWTDLRVMHLYYGFAPNQGKNINRQHLKHRLRFLQEELDETKEALKDNSPTELIDGLIDLIVVAVGTLDLLNISNPSVWKEVMRANMAKEVGTKASRPDSGGMDLIKPDGWKPPNLSPFISRLLADIMAEVDVELPQVSERASIAVLNECAEVMRAKSADYASSGSSVQAADYYPNGADDFVYMIDVLKRNRQNSVIDAAKNGQPVNNESLEDTLKDRINYLALFIEWLRGQTPGQLPGRDLFNKQVEG